ncbi:hypothetical protein Ddc_07241 [Ditylenchus destructor]|nr:hypothetical protein Ddc_07241 [Ditylenchus destructor]
MRFQFKEKVKENGAPAAFEWLNNEVDSTMFVTIARMYLTSLSDWRDFDRFLFFYPTSYSAEVIKKLEPVVIEVNLAHFIIFYNNILFFGLLVFLSFLCFRQCHQFSIACSQCTVPPGWFYSSRPPNQCAILCNGNPFV